MPDRLYLRRGHPPQGWLIDRSHGPSGGHRSLLHLLPEPLHRHARPLSAAGVVVVALVLPRVRAAQTLEIATRERARRAAPRKPAAARLGDARRRQQGALRKGQQIRARMNKRMLLPVAAGSITDTRSLAGSVVTNDARMRRLAVLAALNVVAVGIYLLVAAQMGFFSHLRASLFWSPDSQTYLAVAHWLLGSGPSTLESTHRPFLYP